MTAVHFSGVSRDSSAFLCFSIVAVIIVYEHERDGKVHSIGILLVVYNMMVKHPLSFSSSAH